MQSNLLSAICVGPQRTGSSYLYTILNQSKELSLPQKVKELYFFDKNYLRGFKWYWSFFRGEGHLKTLDIAPTAFTSTKAAKRIFDHNPKCKIIILYRDPMDKAYSLYKHHRSKGRGHRDVIKMFRLYPEIVNSCDYKTNILVWRKWFPSNQVLLMDSKEMYSNEQKFVREICRFLDVNTFLYSKEGLDKNESGFPRYKTLAKVGDKFAKGLRVVGLHSLVNILKRVGFKNVFKGGKVDMSKQEFCKVLENYIDFELVNYENLKSLTEGESFFNSDVK